ncbi:MAG TPA: 30S ribosomal protein S20 [Nitrospiraceae bacterium]|jgi:small subunit ribosomal protein S20|nr:30S ribosomal protein S20 [Nitrospiraceae bacterium]
MAVVHKSTIRRARQSERRRQRNRATLSAVKSLVKKVLIAVDQKKVEEAKASLREATSALSKAVTKGVLKRNTASRRISRLAARVNSLTASQSS